MGDTDKIYEVNLQEVVEKYVWKRFKEDNGFFRNMFFRKNRHYIDIRWGFLDFKHTTTSTDRPLPLSAREKNLDLYVSEYENDTSDTQTFTFSTSRETTATTKVEIQDSYTIGAETNLEVDLGGIVKLGGGVSGEMSVTNTKGEEHTETQSWNIDTEVVVPSKNKAVATLELKEVARVTDFEVKTVISLTKGSLPVSIRRISDNEVVKTYWIMNISRVFDKNYLERSKDMVKILKEKKEGTNKIDIKVELTTRGVCRSVSGKEQRVKVEYKPMGPESSPKTQGKEDKQDAPTTGDPPKVDEKEDKTDDSVNEDDAINGITKVN